VSGGTTTGGGGGGVGGVQMASLGGNVPTGGTASASDPTNVTTGTAGNQGGPNTQGFTNYSGSITPSGVNAAWNTMANTGTGTMGGAVSQPASGTGDISNLIRAGSIGNLASAFLAPKITPSAYAPINQPLVSAQTSAQGMENMLTAPTTSGVLPAGEEQSLNYERREMNAAAEGQAAKTGMGASTQLRDAKINNAARIEAQKVDIAQQMLREAQPYAQMANSDATALSAQLNNQNTALTNQMQAALGNFLRSFDPAQNGTGNRSTASTYNPPSALNPSGTTSTPASGASATGSSAYAYDQSGGAYGADADYGGGGDYATA
jgi:hypothetical protein